MALQKSIETPSGAFAEYWKIESIYLNCLTHFCEISLGGFFNQQTRIDNKPQLENKRFIVSTNDFLTFVGNPQDIQKTAYEYIKALNGGEFTDALDV